MRLVRKFSSSNRDKAWELVDGLVSFVRKRPSPGREELERLLEHGLVQVDGVSKGAPAAKLLLEWQAIDAEVDTRKALNRSLEAIRMSQGDDSVEMRSRQVRIGALETVSRLNLRLGMDDEAVENARKAVEEAESYLEENEMLHWTKGGVPTSNLAAYGALGAAQLARGDVASAMDAYSAVADVFPNPHEVEGCLEDLSAEELSSACTFLNELGHLHHVLSGLPESDAESDMEVWLQSHEASRECYDLCVKMLEPTKKKTKLNAEVLGCPISLEELEADVHCGLSQLYACIQSWREAESHAEKSLAAAERAGEDSHPRVGMTLLQMGHVFLHTNRLTLGEGLYRKAGELLKDTKSHDFPNNVVVHPTVVALWNWRYAQLLSLMPRRGSEVESLKAEAVRLWKSSADLKCNNEEIETLLRGAMGAIGRASSLSEEGAEPSKVRMCERSAVMMLRMGRVIIPGHWPWANKM